MSKAKFDLSSSSPPKFMQGQSAIQRFAEEKTKRFEAKRSAAGVWSEHIPQGLIQSFIIAGVADLEGDLARRLEVMAREGQLTAGKALDLHSIPFTGEVLDAFPWPGKKTLTAESPELLFPSGVEITRGPPPRPTIYHVILTSEKHKRRYVTCLMLHERLAPQTVQRLRVMLLEATKTFTTDVSDTTTTTTTTTTTATKAAGDEDVYYVPKTFCLMSSIPCYTFARNWLSTFYRLWEEEEEEEVKEEGRKSATATTTTTTTSKASILSVEAAVAYATRVPLPLPGAAPMGVSLEGRELGEVFYPPPSELPYMDFPLYFLFDYLSIENVLRVFWLLLLDEKVILVSRNASVLTFIGDGLQALLYPLVPTASRASVLPFSAHECLGSPVSYVYGVQREVFDAIPREFTAGAAVVDVDSDTVELAAEQKALPPIPPTPLALLRCELNEIKNMDKRNMAEIAWDPWATPFSHTKDFNVYVRIAFLKFFASLLRDYHKYVHFVRVFPAPAIVRFSRGPFINAFLASDHSNERDSKAYVQFFNALFTTQPFVHFMEQRARLESSLFDLLLRKVFPSASFEDLWKTPIASIARVISPAPRAAVPVLLRCHASSSSTATATTTTIAKTDSVIRKKSHKHKSRSSSDSRADALAAIRSLDYSKIAAIQKSEVNIEVTSEEERDDDDDDDEESEVLIRIPISAATASGGSSGVCGRAHSNNSSPDAVLPTSSVVHSPTVVTTALAASSGDSISCVSKGIGDSDSSSNNNSKAKTKPICHVNEHKFKTLKPVTKTVSEIKGKHKHHKKGIIVVKPPAEKPGQALTLKRCNRSAYKGSLQKLSYSSSLAVNIHDNNKSAVSTATTEETSAAATAAPLLEGKSSDRHQAAVNDEAEAVLAVQALMRDAIDVEPAPCSSPQEFFQSTFNYKPVVNALSAAIDELLRGKEVGDMELRQEGKFKAFLSTRGGKAFIPEQVAKVPRGAFVLSESGFGYIRSLLHFVLTGSWTKDKTDFTAAKAVLGVIDRLSYINGSGRRVFMYDYLKDVPVWKEQDFWVELFEERVGESLEKLYTNIPAAIARWRGKDTTAQAEEEGRITFSVLCNHVIWMKYLGISTARAKKISTYLCFSVGLKQSLLDEVNKFVDMS